jgi:hypothetical protein
MSDISSALAWYADRRSVHLPCTVDEAREIIRRFGGIGGALFLAPIAVMNFFRARHFQSWAPFFEMVKQGYYPKESGFHHGQDLMGQGFFFY